MIKKMLKDCLTEKDNETFDVVRILGCFAFFSFHGLAFSYIVKSCGNLNFIEIATGMSMLLAVIGAGVTYKYTKEN